MGASSTSTRTVESMDLGPVLVERATTGRTSQLRAVRLAALAADPTAFASTLQKEEGMSPKDWDARAAEGAWYVATTGSRPVGLAALTTRPEEPAAADLSAVWVTPEHRGRGVGDLLVGEALKGAWAAGYVAAVLYLVDGSHAEELYLRHGFTRTGRWLPHLNHPEITVVEMRLDLRL